MSHLVESHEQPNSSEDATNRNSLKEKSAHTPVSEKELLYAPTGGQPAAVNQPKPATVILVATILGGWILAVAFACAHYGFAMTMNHKLSSGSYRGTPSDAVWGFSSTKSGPRTITIIFVRGVVLSLTVSAGGILTQMVCIVPSTRLNVTIYILHANVASYYRSGVFQTSTQSHSSKWTRSSGFLLFYRQSPFFSPMPFRMSG
jgi:hypothetical protein